MKNATSVNLPPHVTIKTIERTLYPPIRDLLKDLGFEVVQEVGIEPNKYIDLLVTYDGIPILLEIKIGTDFNDLLKGLVQVWEYSVKRDIRNIVVLVFPIQLSNYQTSIEEYEKKVKGTSCVSLFLTDFWCEYGLLTIDESLGELRNRLDKKLSASKSISLTSEILRQSIQLVSNLISTHYKDLKQFDNAVDYLTKKQGLMILNKKWQTNQSKKMPKYIQSQVINLLAYILINQILFYFLFSKRTKKVKPIEHIIDLNELHAYFYEIRKINFKPIFDIDVISHIPKSADIAAQINLIIRALSALRVDEIKYDLYGRLIGKSMPTDTKKAFSSYYTKVTASEILAGLSISKWNETVWDTACGSGTILVSAYNKKLELFNNLKGLRISTKDKEDVHKIFLEKQLTGTDYMPFACHLTGLNLSAQNLNVYPNILRIANKNSLEIFDLPCEVSEAYGTISKAVGDIRDKTEYITNYIYPNIEQVKEIDIKEKTFTLEKPDVVLINPPFTRLQNLPSILKKESTNKNLAKICGNEINYWGYFLAHADKIVKSGGRIGAIIPGSFLRGKRTQKIREYIMTNYAIDYIIKPPEGFCFSEDSDFGDIILIARKSAPENQNTRLVFLHGDILERSPEDIKEVIRKIESQIVDAELDTYSIKTIRQKELIIKKDNLSSFFFSNNISSQDKINIFVQRIGSNFNMKKLERKLMEAGHQLRGKERPKESVITRNLSEARLSKSKYYFNSDNNMQVLEFFDKDHASHKISKSKLSKTFRSCIDVDTINISSKYDYFILDKLHKKKSSFLLIPSRVELVSEHTHALAFYTDELISPLDTFIMYMPATRDIAKLICLYIQSIFFLAQLLTVAKISKGTGAFANYVEIKLAYLQEILVPDFEKIDELNKKLLLDYFDKLQDIKLPSIKVQYLEKNNERIYLDTLLNNTLKLGFSKSDIDDMYKIIYDIIC